MRSAILAAGAAVMVMGMAAAAGPAAAQAPNLPQAQAAMVDAQGKALGTITVTQYPQAALIHAELDGLAPGWHAVHIHENGTCTPDFSKAGGHFNPGGGQHGIDAAPMHAGDLPNFWVNEAGKSGFEVFTEQVTLEDGQASLFKPGGTAFIIHAQRDDYVSEPAGASGDRVACGVIARR